MKKLFIFSAILITISLFLPFIKDVSLFELYNFLDDKGFDASGVLPTVFAFLVGSWCLALGYSKEVKVSILGIIGTIIYFYFFYQVFTFVTEAQGTYDYGVSNFGRDNTNNVILKTINEFAEYLSIGFYCIFIGFILNTLPTFNVIGNLIKLSGNTSYYAPRSELRVYTKGGNINLSKETVEPNFSQNNQKSDNKNALKIAGIFVISNLFALISSVFIQSFINKINHESVPGLDKPSVILLLLLSVLVNGLLTEIFLTKFFIKISEKAIDKILIFASSNFILWIVSFIFWIFIGELMYMDESVLFFGPLINLAILNIYLANKYVKKFMESTKLIKILFIAFLAVTTLYIKIN